LRLRCAVREGVCVALCGEGREKGKKGRKEGGEYLRIEEVNGREDGGIDDRKDDVRLVADVFGRRRV
jgi:hypothetical protein